jgi:two-component system sensor histidine kinase KdpD
MDFALFGQVLVNVIDNAIKYSPKDASINIDVTEDDRLVYVKISDRGIGIPEEDLTKVFDKFYRVSRPESVNGTGLGLAICKGIIEALHGTIKADNRPGGGTVIIIALPKGATT